jgi:hypothetical protein
VKKIANFFNFSAKRTTCLQSKIDSNVRHKKLKNVCPTRWVESHSAVIRFVELLCPVFDALEDLSTQGGDTGSQATMLLRGIDSFDFLVAIHVMEDMCGLLLPLSKALQSQTADLSAGMHLVDDNINVLETRL